MTAVAGLNAVDICLIKRFRFPEPVFFPDRLHKKWWPRLTGEDPDGRFLSDADQINALINAHRAVNVAKGLTLQPICNPNTYKNLFWAGFKPHQSVSPIDRHRPLPMFPFRATLTELRVAVESDVIAAALRGMSDVKFRTDIYIYPAGVVTARVSTYLEVPSGQLDLSDVFSASKALTSIMLTATTGRRTWTHAGVPRFLDFMVTQVTRALLEKSNPGRDIEGYYTVYSFHGQAPGWRGHEELLSRLLLRESNPQSSDLRGARDTIRTALEHRPLHRFIRTRDPNDLVVVGKRTALMFVDDGIRKKYVRAKTVSIREGRRCFRGHLTSSIELAYAVDALVGEYSSKFQQLIDATRALPLMTSLPSLLRKAVTFGVMRPVAYRTLTESILRVPQMLEVSRADGFWAGIYISMGKELGTGRRAQDLAENADELLNRSEAFTNRRFQQTKSMLQAVRDTALEIARVLQPGPSSGA